MNQDIIKLARQAGYDDIEERGIYMFENFDVEAFAKLVALHYEKKIADLENIIAQRHWDVLQEREACAAICDRFQARDVGMQPAECAGAIRARGEQK